MKSYLKTLFILISFPTFAQKVPENLNKHTEEFKKEIIKVSEGVYCAIGYGIANARHYFYTVALELGNKAKSVNPKVTPKSVSRFPLSAYFSTMSTNLIPAKTDKMDKVAVFKFEDTKETFSLHIRKGVCEIQPVEMPNAQLIVKTTSQIWKENVARIRSMPESVKKGDIKIEKGSEAEFFELMTLFVE